jgi:hypothetical protein
MTWEWVTLILGFCLLLTVLFGFIAWTQMKTKINETIPKTIPDMMARTKQEDVTQVK